FDRGNYQGAVEAINAYFDKFPKPIQEKHARFIRGESYARLGKDKEALHDCNIIMNDWTSGYTEQTLVSGARLHLKNTAYNEAVPVLRKVGLTSEYKWNYGFAINNQLISYYHIGEFVETLRYAELVKEHDKSSQEDIALAHLYAGKASLATKKPADALSAFTM